MKICIPVIGKNVALVNLLAEDFYKANFYCVHDVDVDQNEVLSKEELMIRFGLDLRKGGANDVIEAIISPNIRPMAYKILADNEIKVFRPLGNLVDENIRHFKELDLLEHDPNSVEQPMGCSSSSCKSCSSTSCSS